MKKYEGKTTEQKREEVKSIVKNLEEGVKNVFNTEEYKKALQFFSKFHQYSMNNSILIAMQMPDASVVGSFQHWKTVGAKVKKGSKAIKILCPVKYNYEVENEDGTIEQKSGMTFRLGNVFDISQTDAKVPSLTKELKGNNSEINTLIQKIISSYDKKIVIDAALNKKKENGYYSLLEDDIHIKENLDDCHKLKTIIHEMAHSILHTIDEKKYTRNECEVQAESVAYVTCNYLGIDSSNYSFGYIAGWSTGKTIKELKSSLNLIEKTSKKIISFIEGLK